MNRNAVSQELARHYSQTFQRFGPTSRGVDWGPDTRDHSLRLDLMLDVLRYGVPTSNRPSLLDVGCGYGSLIDRANDRNLPLSFTGIDICQPMIDFARKRHPHANWIVGDFLSEEISQQSDYVVCNGILTQKLEATIRDMDEFLKLLVRRMFDSCRIGCAFNVMSSHVNFMSPRLYYRSPAELLAWCMNEISSRVIVNSAYPLFEFTVYLYREDVDGLKYGDHRKV